MLTLSKAGSIMETVLKNHAKQGGYRWKRLKDADNAVVFSLHQGSKEVVVSLSRLEVRQNQEQEPFCDMMAAKIENATATLRNMEAA